MQCKPFISSTQLLICGTEDVRYKDMRKHSLVVEGDGPYFSNILSNFWTAVRRMSQEERAMLLQFSTGSSILPNGGFGELVPPFTISIIQDENRLPSAHTW